MSFPHGGEEAHAQYIDESTYGTTPTNPTFHWIGVIQNVEPALDPSLIKLHGIGSRTLQYLLRGLRKVDLKMEYAYQNKAFLNKITGGWPTGSGMPMSIEVFYNKPSDGSLTLTMLHKGCLLDRLTVRGDILGDPEVIVEAALIGQDVNVSAAHPTGSTDATDPGTTPKTVADDVSLTIGGVEPDDIYDFRFSIINNLKRYPVIRSSNSHLLKYLLGRGLDLEIEMTAYLTDKDYLDGLLADWSGPIVFTIGSDIYTFSNCKYDGILEPTRLIAEVPQKLKFTAKSLAIT